MKQVDRSSPMPLWAQIEQDLRSRIAAAEFEEHFPTEAELTAEYDVSRQTVREALRRLTTGGLLDRHRGRGTALATASILEQPVGRFYSLARTIEAQGIPERSELLLREFRADAEASAHLSVAPESSLLHFKRLRFASREPFATDDSWLLEDAGRLVVDRDFQQGSLYAFLSDAGGPRVSGARERIRAEVPDDATRSALKLRRGIAVLVIERLAYAGERAFEWRTSVVRGDRFAFVAEWAGSATPPSHE